MQAWTDYPITELGDTPGKRARIRKCEVLFFDGDKYCQVRVNDVLTEIKAGYLYVAPGRYGEVRSINPDDLPEKNF